mgnify:CR=1 FL=1
MRNNNTGFWVVDKKLCEMRDTLLVEIVGRLVEEQNIRVLNKRLGKQRVEAYQARAYL